MTNKKSSASYQEMIVELDALLAWFQSEDVNLDGAIGKYEQAMELIQKLENHIRNTENNIEKIKQRLDTATVA